ncbi:MULTISPECIES: hypothetical protein [Aeromicrobium]|jgi:hypothetical protein|uniref:XRE family transcriptional regulator n=1 Tax=Aeromicrobium erythreum TaxID=2041 RepID=A0A0U4C090_9ACTN|nr:MULTISPECIES: hypothetical protein [Aeromicrobium]ALX04479.1 hypothetical protein AERYTH_07125 [Aeromicrobium erythreum]MCO7240212.1 hypothetical protein [Aeromicrobium sp. CnD17-E]
MSTLAERLNAWFADAATRDPVGRMREPSTAEVAQAISESPEHDVTISRSYLAALRSGAQTNPTVSVLSALVHYFKPRAASLPISMAALTGEEEDDAGWAQALADRQVRSIAMRAGELTPEARSQLLTIMDALDASRRETGQP